MKSLFKNLTEIQNQFRSYLNQIADKITLLSEIRSTTKSDIIIQFKNTILFTGLIIVGSAGSASALNISSIDGIWTNITGSSGSPSCLDDSLNNPSNARIFYGSSDFRRCRTPQSGFGFEDGPARTVNPGENFVLGQYTHFNNPIFATSNLARADIEANLIIDGQAVTLSYRVTLDETPNSGICAYDDPNVANDVPCPDKITITPITSSIRLNNQRYLVTGGFVSNPSANIANCDINSTPISEFITQERTNNSACVFANLEAVTTTISGTVYEDSDGGDDLDASEPKLPAGITVNLLDNSDNSIIKTTTTQSDGTYTFTEVLNGNYKIQVDTNDSDIPTGYTLGTSNDLVVTVADNPVSNQNFGFDKPPATTTISGTLYEDTDNDDNLDAGETKIPDITINLLDSGDNVIQTTTTDANGSYTFAGVVNGNYKIQVDTNDSDIPSGYTLSTSNDLVVTVADNPVSNQNFGFDEPTSNRPLGSPFTCDSTFYITIGNSGGPQQLYDLNRSGSTFSFDPRGTATDISGGYPVKFDYNALAYNPVDNYLYGYINRSDATDGPYSSGNIVKIGNDGILHSLGKPTGKALPNGTLFAATVLSDGTYVVGGSNRFAFIDVTTTPPTVLDAGTVSGTNFADFAVDPKDPASLSGKRVYGVTEDGQLVIIDMTSFPPSISSQAPNPTGFSHNAGSQFVDAFGILYYRSNSDQKLYRVNTDPNSSDYGKATEITTAPSGGNHDGASCLFAAAMEKEIEDNDGNLITEIPAGETVNYVYKIATGNVLDLSGVTFTDDLRSVTPGSPINGTYTGNVTVSNNSGNVSFTNDNQTLVINNLTLPGQVVNQDTNGNPVLETLTITAEVTVPKSTTPGTYNNQSFLTNLPAQYPPSIPSDYPRSAPFEDPTPVDVTEPIANNPNDL